MRRCGRWVRRGRWLAAVVGTMAAAACSESGGPLAPPPTPGRLAHPGFDTSLYPGDAAMQAWRASPYEWAGYYLAAPCHRDASWTGRRAALQSMGWGLAVIYVGQQDWANMDRLPAESGALRGISAQSAPTCSASLLSAAQGSAEADDAAAKAAADGFAAGSVIYLDLEPVQTVTSAFAAYVRGWMERVLADGRYTPGVYANGRNAREMHDLARAAYAARGRTGAVPFWVASTSGFSVDAAPWQSGYDFATAWQGRLDVTETWAGVTLRVDESVAATPAPSAPR